MRSRESSRVPLFAALLVATVAMLLGFAYVTVVTQHATGIYSQGQARWMQAHVRVVMYLHRYARRGEPAALAAARGAMRIPDAYARARGHLQSGAVDRDAAIRAFMDGDLPRADAQRAARYIDVIRVAPDARGVLASWRAGDAWFDTLMVIADTLEQAHARGDTATVRSQIARIEAADEEMNRLERVFAGGLADLSRQLPWIVLAVGAVLGTVLIVASIVTVRAVAQTADRARSAQVEYFRRLHTLMEGIPDLIAWNDRDGRYTFVNAAVERAFGYSRAEMIGITPREFAAKAGIPSSVIDQWDASFARCLAGEQNVAMVLELPDASGRVQVHQFRLAAVRDDAGMVQSVMAIGRDITALRESEAALRERDLQLQHAQKMEAVGRLAGGVAHEFNNILTAVTANIELALIDLDAESETRRELLDALAAARRAGSLTRQLLVFGRRDAVETRPLDLGRLVAELEPMLQRLAGDTVHVVTTQGTARPVIMGDAGQIQQILFNLVSNARDAMPEGGTMHIDVGNASVDELRRHKGVMHGDFEQVTARGAVSEWTTLTVRDTGTGMLPETVSRLFEPFFTTKGPGAGSGLGLPVVNGIVMQLGGCICVETEPGNGTTVTVAFPALEAGAATGDGAAGAPEATALFAMPGPAVPAGTGELVLLVEDEAPVRAAARRMLEHAGYRVREAKHADDALLQWAKGDADVVVTDFMMPGLNGGELIARLRQERPGLPALIVSGYTGGDTIDTASLGDNTALLQKPFTRADLLQQVRALLDGEV